MKQFYLRWYDRAHGSPVVCHREMVTTLEDDYDKALKEARREFKRRHPRASRTDDLNIEVIEYRDE